MELFLYNDFSFAILQDTKNVIANNTLFPVKNKLFNDQNRQSKVIIIFPYLSPFSYEKIRYKSTNR